MSELKRFLSGVRRPVLVAGGGELDGLRWALARGLETGEVRSVRSRYDVGCYDAEEHGLVILPGAARDDGAWDAVTEWVSCEGRTFSDDEWDGGGWPDRSPVMGRWIITMFIVVLLLVVVADVVRVPSFSGVLGALLLLYVGVYVVSLGRN